MHLPIHFITPLLPKMVIFILFHIEEYLCLSENQENTIINIID